MSEVRLEVNGVRYVGWEGMTVSRSIESIADTFSLEVSDHGSEWPIVEEDECKVFIDDELILTGFVERPTPSFTETTSRLNVSGYGKSAALAANSAVLDKWSFRSATVADIARKVSEPFGISVSVKPGLVLEKIKKLVVNPGDTAFEVIQAAALATGVLVVSTKGGGILITRSGTERTFDSLVQGVNMKGGSGDYDASIRYHKYIVLGQSPGTDQSHANATRLRGEAFDDGVKRKDRVLLVRAEAGHSTKLNRQRGDWEARSRAAAAKAASIVVQGWKQTNGALWPVNKIVPVRSSKLRIAQDMLIAQVDYSKDASGEIATIRVVRPDAYQPDPTARVRG